MIDNGTSQHKAMSPCSSCISPEVKALADHCNAFGFVVDGLEQLSRRFPDLDFVLEDRVIAKAAPHESRIVIQSTRQTILIRGEDTVRRETAAIAIQCLLPTTQPCMTVIEGLQESHEQWEEVANQLPLEVYALAEDFTILRTNAAAAAAMGRPFDSCIGLPFEMELVGGEATLKAALPSHDERSRVYLTCAGDNGCHTVHVSAFSPAGFPAGYILIREDATEEVRLHQMYMRQTRLAEVGELTMGLSHELNSPMEVIWVAADALSRRFGDDPKAQRYLEMIHEEVERCRRLTRELLDFGKIPERGTDVVDLKKLLAQIPYRITSHEHPIEIACEEAAWILGKADDLQRLLVNLTTNAITASRPRRPVLLRMTTSGRRALIHVENEGPGIPPEDLEKIYQPFFTRTKGGTGLGLPIAIKIVQMHGGRLWYNHQPGRTTFSVELPLTTGPHP